MWGGSERNGLRGSKGKEKRKTVVDGIETYYGQHTANMIFTDVKVVFPQRQGKQGVIFYLCYHSKVY